MAKHEKGAIGGNGQLILTNTQIRQAAKGIELLLQERLPREAGIALQTRYQMLKFALVPVDLENDRLVKMYAKKNRKGQLVPADNGQGYQLAPATAQKCVDEINALWSMEQRVKIEKLNPADLPAKIEGKDLVVPGIVWEWIAPISNK